MAGTHTHSRNMAEMGKVKQLFQDEDALEWLAVMESHVLNKGELALF
jgi:hypothetical protein